MARNTQQRTAIRQVILEAGRPLSHQEVLERAQRLVPKLGIATVYRAVKQLLEDESIRTVEIPQEPIRFEARDIPHHHHFSCQQCGRVFDIEGCPLTARPSLPSGFALKGHEVILYGLCADCNGAPA